MPYLKVAPIIDLCFAPAQRKALRAIAGIIYPTHGPLGDASRLAISKIIITKEPRASLARDISHSRPHRVVTTSTYDVVAGFRKAVAQMAKDVENIPSTSSATEDKDSTGKGEETCMYNAVALRYADSSNTSTRS